MTEQDNGFTTNKGGASEPFVTDGSPTCDGKSSLLSRIWERLHQAREVNAPGTAGSGGPARASGDINTEVRHEDTSNSQTSKRSQGSMESERRLVELHQHLRRRSHWSCSYPSAGSDGHVTYDHYVGVNGIR